MSATAVQVTLVLSFFLALAAHEGAHAIAGALAGFPLYGIGIGPLDLARNTSGSWRLALRRPNQWFSGKTCAHPATSDTAAAKRLVRTIAAGPAISIVLGLLATGVAPGMGFRTPLGQACIIFALCSLGIGISALIPNRWLEGNLSDGGVLFRIATAPRAASYFTARAVLAERQHRGVRPREWEPTLLVEACSVKDGSPESVFSSLLAYYHALDTRSLDDADIALQEVIKGLPTLRGQQLRRVTHDAHLEAAYLSAAHHADSQRASQFLDTERTCSPLCVAHARAEAAVLATNGKSDEARARIAPVLSQVSVPYLREWLERSAEPQAAG